jgi:hypothetical protein
MKMEKIGLFATPSSYKELEAYLNNFNGSEGVVAWTAFGMTWNLITEKLLAGEIEIEDARDDIMMDAVSEIESIISNLESVKDELDR